MGKKIVRLTESDLIKVIKRVLEEQQTISRIEFTGPETKTTSTSKSTSKSVKYKTERKGDVYRIYVDSDGLDGVDKYIDAEEVFGPNEKWKDYKDYNEIKSVLMGLMTGKIKP